MDISEHVAVNNAEIYLKGIPVDKIVHPEMDPQNPYKPGHTGIFEESVNISGNIRNFKTYIPESFGISGPFVMVFAEDKKDDFEGWLSDSGWKRASESNGIIVCVLYPENGKWNYESDKQFAEGVFLSKIDRCLYESNESVIYAVGYGEGSRIASMFAIEHSDWVTGFFCGDESCVSKDDIEKLRQIRVGFGDKIGTDEAQYHAWIVRKDDSDEHNLSDFLLSTGKYKDEKLHNSVAAVYKSDPVKHFFSINTEPVGEIWLSKEAEINSVPATEQPEMIWEFLGRVKRWRGQSGGCLRPHRTPEEEHLIRFEKEIDGFRRYWQLFVPSEYYRHPEKKYPLVVAMHGYSCCAEIHAENSDWHIVGEERSFFVLYPTALPDTWAGNWTPLPTWHCGFWKKDGFPDDCHYILEAINETCLHYSIDSGRIYAAGHSNGGAMCQELMIQCPDTFAAFAPAGYTTGNFGESIPEIQCLKRPVWLHKSEYDLFDGADLSCGTVNQKFIEMVCKASGADYDHPCIRKNGRYEHVTYLDDRNVPMVRFTKTGNMDHTYTPELAWMTWDDFFSHFSLSSDGNLEYLI